MKKNAVTAILEEALERSGDGSDLGSALREIDEGHAGLMRKYRAFIVGIDPVNREDWPLVIAAALKAGVTDEEMLEEVGSSPSTVSRWLNERVAPREGTRKLIKKALVDLLDGKLEEHAARPRPNEEGQTGPLAMAPARRRAG